MISDKQYNALIIEGALGKAREALDEKALDSGCISDDNGKPLRLYHGTRTVKFKAFKSPWKGRGLYLTSNVEVARYFANRLLPGVAPKAIMHPKNLGENLSILLRRLEKDEFEFGDFANLASFLSDEIGLRVSISQDREAGRATIEIEDFPHDNLSCHMNKESGLFSLDNPILLSWLEHDLGNWIDFAYEGNVYYAYAFSDNPMEIDAHGKGWDTLGLELPEGVFQSVDEMVKYAFERGHDCLIVRNVLEYNGSPVADDVIVKSPNHIKSCDLITEDDEGNVIPLSKRFSGSDDIREEDGMSERLKSHFR